MQIRQGSLFPYRKYWQNFVTRDKTGYTSPTATTTPAKSLPSVAGSLKCNTGLNIPVGIMLSIGLRPTACTFTRISSAPGKENPRHRIPAQGFTITFKRKGFHRSAFHLFFILWYLPVTFLLLSKRRRPATARLTRQRICPLTCPSRHSAMPSTAEIIAIVLIPAARA